MNVETIAVYVKRKVFQISGKIFTLNSDRPKMITDYNFRTTGSLDAKTFVGFLDEMRSDKHAPGKSVENRNVTKKIFQSK